MAVSLLGINHASAPVQLREQIAFDPALLSERLVALKGFEQIDECVILSTCNRTELVFAHVDNIEHQSVQASLWQWLSTIHELSDESSEALKQAAYYLHQEEAIAHMIEVASGLDSMVLGEPQVFGQVKQAYEAASDMQTIGKELSFLYPFVFNATKKIRTETGIGQHVVSFASAAMRLGKRLFSGFEQHSALLIGAGETIDLVAQHLRDNNIGNITIANRSIARAQKLAEKHQAKAVTLDKLTEQLPLADIVFTSTASPDPILYKENFEVSLKLRKRKPMFVVDLAVPRDVCDRTKDLEDIYLYTVDDLQLIINKNQASRVDESEKAKQLLKECLAQYESEHIIRSSDVIQTFRQHFEQRRDTLLTKAQQALTQGQDVDNTLSQLAIQLTTPAEDNFEQQRGELLTKAQQKMSQGEDVKNTLIQFATQLTNKFLHQPTASLRDALANKDQDRLKDVINLYMGQSRTNSTKSDQTT